MKKLILIKEILIDLGGLIQTVVYIFVGGIWIWNKLSIGTSTQGFFLFLVVTILLILFLRKIIKNSFESINLIYLENSIENDIENLAKEAKQIKFKLPTTKQLRKWETFLDDKARKWSEDFEKHGMALFIEVNERFPSIKGQLNYESIFLNQRLTLHTGSKHVQKEYISNHKFGKCNSFFEEYEKWDKAIYKAYKQIQNRLGRNYKLSVNSHSDEMSLCFSFKEGDVERKIYYKYNGNTLKDPNDKEIAVE